MNASVLTRFVILALLPISILLSSFDQRGKQLSPQLPRIQFETISEVDFSSKSIQNFEEQKQLFELVVSGQRDSSSLSPAEWESVKIFEERKLLPGSGPYTLSPFYAGGCASRPSSIYASSEKQALGAVHSAQHLIDLQLENAWVEGVGGNGIGQAITYRYEDAGNSSPQKLALHNGYIASDSLWSAFGRAKELVLYVDQKAVAVLELADVPHLQIGDLSEVIPASSFPVNYRIEIQDIYAGQASEDVALSELNFIFEHCP